MYFRDQEDKIMRIALINENSQAGKNEIIYRELKGVVEGLEKSLVIKYCHYKKMT